MRNLKRYCMMMATLSMVVFGCVACGSEKDTQIDTPTQEPTVEATAKPTDDANKDDESAGTTNDANQESDDENADGTMTEDKAVELVKKELGEDYGYMVGEELVEKDGSQYYEVYVSVIVDGHSSTVTTYMVKTDGSEVFDKYAEETDDETTDSTTDEVKTISGEEAAELVKNELGEEYGYMTGEELVEKDGSQYYEVYVSVVLEDGHSSTVTTYLVKTDGTEVFDKYAEEE